MTRRGAMLTFLMTLAGLLLVAATLWDVFRSLVRTALAPGFVTRAAVIAVCHTLLALFHATGRRGFLAAIGPASVMARGIAVVLALALGWGLVLFAHPDWVVIAKTGAPAPFWERVYFTGYTVATLGLGDVTPKGAWPQVVTVGASLTGFLVLTFIVGAISTLSQVVATRDAVISGMQAHAAALAAGADPDAARDRTLDMVVDPLAAIASGAHALPLQNRLHAERADQAFSVALDWLDRMGGDPRDPRVQSVNQSIDTVLSALAQTWLDTEAADRRGRLDAYLRSDRLPHAVGAP